MNKIFSTDEKILYFNDIFDALDILAADVRTHQHSCPGFDCATCTPIEALSIAEAILEKVKK